MRNRSSRHPYLTLTLYAFMFTPAILLIILAGRLLRQLIPAPLLWQILLVAPALILILIGGMIFGTVLYVLAMKPFVAKETLAKFYIYPGVPVFSALSAAIFHWAYRKRGADHP